ncbi:hypothetical protein GH714_016662 [Hevea brasiliensis]|uniref:Amino acid transporter transmembrane domain-containing protein n=1 Tax=Hevea brasiliensis TaxID=3981 RepID=A0A6A6NI40_HEVBR|nr:hypothetical protein GH714_016662 [Hevea brasiliensis]
MGEVVEDNNSAIPPPPVSASPFTYGSSQNTTPNNFLSPLGSPLRKVIKLTKLDPQDAWPPITESRNGNAFYAALHNLCAGIGIQALVLPVSFTILGWTRGIISLTVAHIWQLYTQWLLARLHESTETAIRYSRYLNSSVLLLATMPSSEKKPSHVPMWRGMVAACLIIAL